MAEQGRREVRPEDTRLPPDNPSNGRYRPALEDVALGELVQQALDGSVGQSGPLGYAVGGGVDREVLIQQEAQQRPENPPLVVREAEHAGNRNAVTRNCVDTGLDVIVAKPGVPPASACSAATNSAASPSCAFLSAQSAIRLAWTWSGRCESPRVPQTMSTSTASWETRDVDVSLGDLKGRSFGKSPHTDPCDIVERFEVAMEVRKRDGVRFAPVVNGDHNPQTSPAAT